MQFRLWLENKHYDKFRDKINTITRNFVFSPWFNGQERIYIPFQNTSQTSNIAEEINEYLKNFHGGVSGFPLSPGGYEITDYKMGFAKPIGAVKSNVYKISKILDTIQVQEIAKNDNEFQNGEISKIKHQEILKMIKDFDVKKDFENDPVRVKKDTLYVVISSNVHDLASMSTGRGWTSCMNLSDGSHAKDVYCEVKDGGFVAYLIRDDDKDIEHPMARIHIRRFDNKKGDSIALPEESVYGAEVPGFIDVVKNWLASKQGDIKPGAYKRKGGSYSDTFQKTHIIEPKTKEQIERIINNEKYSKNAKSYAIESMLKTDHSWDNDFLLKVKNMCIKGYENFANGFALKYPETISKKDFKDIMVISRKEGQDKLLKKFPQYIDEEIVALVSDKSVFANTKVEKQAKQQIMNDFLNTFNYNVGELENHYGQKLNFIDDSFKKLLIFKPLPEPIIRRIVDVVSNIKENDHYYKLITDMVLHIFYMTDSDTPTVQKYYKSLLPNWEKLGGIASFHYVLSRLKENGKDFLPFLKGRLEEIEKKPDSRTKENTIENYLYVIDSIESNGISRKYELVNGGIDDHLPKS